MSQAILTAQPDFVDLALEELQAGATDARMVAELAPGVLLVAFAESFWELADHWQHHPPIFVRHICPVDATAPLVGDEAADLALLEEVVREEFAPLIDPELPFSVQTRVLARLPYRPFQVNRALSQLIQEAAGAPLDVRNPVQVLSVVCAETPPVLNLDAPYVAFLGLSLAQQNLSDWAGGERRFAREKEQVSRSEFKLLEALEAFGVDLPPRGVALDLGASPGGWTRVLRQRQQYVTAVDPGELDPRLAQDKGVRHLRMTAEEYLANEPDTFDIIVNDMRMDARDSARLMVAYARHLYPHGLAIMTFKLPERNRRPVLDHAFNILRQAYDILGARQLFHNRSEITVFLRKKRRPEQAAQERPQAGEESAPQAQPGEEASG